MVDLQRPNRKAAGAHRHGKPAFVKTVIAAEMQHTGAKMRILSGQGGFHQRKILRIGAEFIVPSEQRVSACGKSPAKRRSGCTAGASKSWRNRRFATAWPPAHRQIPAVPRQGPDTSGRTIRRLLRLRFIKMIKSSSVKSSQRRVLLCKFAKAPADFVIRSSQFYRISLFFNHPVPPMHNEFLLFRFSCFDHCLFFRIISESFHIACQTLYSFVQHIFCQRQK